MLNVKWLSFNVRQQHSNVFLKKYFRITNFYNLLKPLLIRIKSFQHFCNESWNHSFKFLPNYFIMNERVWLEGLLVDWLQKKIFDKWVRRFLINSSYLFSERVLFNLRLSKLQNAMSEYGWSNLYSLECILDHYEGTLDHWNIS